MIKNITICPNCGFPLNHHLVYDGLVGTYKFTLLCPACRFSTNPHFIGNATLEVDYPGDKVGKPDTFISTPPMLLAENGDDNTSVGSNSPG